MIKGTYLSPEMDAAAAEVGSDSVVIIPDLLNQVGSDRPRR